MLPRHTYDAVTSEAFTYAGAFIKSAEENGLNSRTFFNDPELALSALITFVHDVAGIPVVEVDRLPAPNYASWLIRVREERFSIGLDSSQMIAWHQMSNMPVRTQRIRSIAHELGHFCLSTSVHSGAAASPIEEEKAWLFAMTFLGSLLGDYSFQTRQPPMNLDDAPRMFI